MTDYSKLSDFEINSAVHNEMLREPYSLSFLGDDRISWEGKDGNKIITKRAPYTKNGVHDYCNSPADAWKIIVANNISILSCGNGVWQADGQAYWVDGAEWQVGGATHENPLQAAMIAFLMMRGAGIAGV